MKERYELEKSFEDFSDRVLSGCFWRGVGFSLVVGGLVYLAFGDCDYGVEKDVGGWNVVGVEQGVEARYCLESEEY